MEKAGLGSGLTWEKAGGEAGKRTGFSHLGPDNSTQVVDFRI